MSEQTVKDVGEFGLIGRLRGILGTGTEIVGVGDDAAVLPSPPGTQILATADMLVQDVHFRLSTSPRDVGRQALAVNVSDIAAMGGRPTYALVSLALPPTVPLSWLEELYRGMRSQAEEAGASISGGNISRTSGPIVIDVFMMGTVDVGHFLTRSGAIPGDVLAVTGDLGDAAARLRDETTPYRPPQPRLRAGVALATSGLVHAMMDVSDGLAADVAHLAAASSVGVTLDASAIPVGAEATRVSRSYGLDPLDLALHGGEDYELLLALPPGAAQRAQTEIAPLPLTVIGRVTGPEDGLCLRVASGAVHPLPTKGWAHF